MINNREADKENIILVKSPILDSVQDVNTTYLFNELILPNDN